MNRKCLVLSTPDLLKNAVVEHIGGSFEKSLSLQLKPLKGYRTGPLETKIVALNQRILQDQQTTWYQGLPITPDCLKSDFYLTAMSEILKNIENQSCLIHDPLLAHSLPLWLSKLDNPLIILCYSHPMECAYHLQQTWRFPLSIGLALWESFVLTACGHLHQQSSVLISTNKVRNSPVNHLKSVFKKLSIPQPNQWAALTQGDLSAAWKTLNHDFQRQSNIFSKLEQGDIASIASMKISSQSADELYYYGQLRAGFENANAERDQLRQKLGLSPQENIETIPSKSRQNDSPLIRLRIHIRGMEVLEFFTDPKSSIIEMLRDSLTNDVEDNLVYLNYGDSENDVLYFMSSKLVALEID